MTDLIVSRGDTFPRAFLDTYRASRTSEQLYNDLKSSKSDELVLQNPADIPIAPEIHHGHSENLLDASGCLSPTENDFLESPEMILRSNRRKVRPDYDRVDPEDSIRDIVTGNDFYRFVLFKKHYDKYVHLSQKYEEARNIAYYLEEKYHEVKMERDDLIQQRDMLSKRLESNESLLREKEDEVFLQFERVVYLEEQCDKLKAEKEKFHQQKLAIEKEKEAAYRLLTEQARESEHTRRKLERARQEVFHHMTRMKYEKESLERENDQLKEALEAERKGMRKYLNQMHQRKKQVDSLEGQLTDRQNTPLASQYQKALQHLATCKKCSVCSYAKTTYRKNSRKYDRKLLGCLQTPFMEMRNMIKPPPSPIHGEGESLSEWFCHLNTPNPSECSSLSVPFAELAITYMDDTSDTSSQCLRDHDVDDSSSQAACNSGKGFGSDSGFSSDICGDFKSNATTPKEKFSPNGTLDEADCAKLTRTRWTASFRKLINRIRK
ncbi:uncharacterized protein LOC123015220 [Tribolium madens]|uniref:uncharacterized protein LOC123015220 n=1 Tax=Tribolium madens TaxID=41895 RepID=UPI001CF741CE|nr:uncharacterized protein LOC123015220 [Tribolium madens]